MGKNMISLDDAAEQLKICKRQVRRMISSGELPAYRVGKSTVIRIDPDDVAALLNPITPNGKR